MLAEILSVAPGQLLQVEVLEGSRPVRDVPIAALVDDTMGLQAYMHIDALRRLMREGRVITGAAVTLDPAATDRFKATVKTIPAVAGVALREAAIQNFRETMAASMNNKGQVHAFDADRKRLAPIIERLKRAGTRNVQVHDRAAGLAPFQEKFDRVLVDAPCTGLGALRRRPEARWRKSPADVPALTQLQTELLTAAVVALKPGGIVAYVTCSPHLAETSGVVADVRRAFGGVLEELDARAVVRSISSTDPRLPAQADGSGRAQLWPHRHNTDAMSITRASAFCRSRGQPSRFPRNCNRHSVMDGGLFGSKNIPASPTTSGRLLHRLASTGTPHDMASSAGSPKPSHNEGNTSAAAPFSNATIRSSSR